MWGALRALHVHAGRGGASSASVCGWLPFLWVLESFGRFISSEQDLGRLYRGRPRLWVLARGFGSVSASVSFLASQQHLFSSLLFLFLSSLGYAPYQGVRSELVVPPSFQPWGPPLCKKIYLSIWVRSQESQAVSQRLSLCRISDEILYQIYHVVNVETPGV